ncbi:MAG: hypothetical protein KBC84_01860 [Proteobacteria bacterium]|nr:hypothetical protein [Pseudomonadota bacterium]
MRLRKKKVWLRNVGLILLLVAVCLVITDLALAAGATSGYDDGEGNKFDEVCKSSLKYLQEDGFSAMLAAIAGIGAIIASALGGFRMAWALLIVSLGSYILGQYVGLFFEGSCGITTGADE